MGGKHLERYVRRLWMHANDRMLNISTADPRFNQGDGWRGPVTASTLHSDNHVYSSPDYYYVRKIISVVRPKPEDVFYDIGSGMGRIVAVWSRLQVKKCVGIEFEESLCDVARSNAANVRGRRSPIEIRCEDAATADVSDGTIYFLFNPFGPHTLLRLLHNIEASLQHNPRHLQIVYYNNTCRDLVESVSWLRPYHSFRTFSDLEVQFFRHVHD